MKTTLLAVASAVALTGCATPVGPKSWTGAPPVVGVLHQSGEPFAGTPVRLVGGLSYDGSLRANAKTVAGRTDEGGRFSLGPLGKKSHAAYIGLFGLGESAADWGLQYQHDGSWQMAWNSRKGIGFSPRDVVSADCDTAREVTDGAIEGAGPGTAGSGICLLTLDIKKR